MKYYINPGHGGNDTGAVGIKGRMEKTDNLKYAKAVAAILESAGHTVKLERADDTFISVVAIARKANEWGADYFISFHRNSASSDANGAECLITSNASAKSREMAQAINDALVSVGFKDRGVKVQDSRTYVLSNTAMPATTIEAGFVTSEIDNKIFDTKFDAIATKTAAAILKATGGESKEKTCMITTPIIKKGSKGEHVRSLQALLNLRGFTDANGDKLNEKGTCGDMTVSAIKKAQKHYGLPQTGNAGEKTLTALYNEKGAK